MLTKDSEMLLSEKVTTRIFDEENNNDDFIEALNAVETIRNKLLHGEWFAFSEPLVKYSHMIMKMIFELAHSVVLEENVQKAA